ncbi:MAG: homoserine kinase [Robiginitalea sp.]
MDKTELSVFCPATIANLSCGFDVLGLALEGVGDRMTVRLSGHEKHILPGSGIGSSAASAAGVVWALNQLLGIPFSLPELVSFAAAGEALASGTPHADNVAPALYGGITLIRGYEPLDIARVHCPPLLHAVVLHPQIELKTSDSRSILKRNITLEQGIRQWGNVGGLITGFFTEDYGLAELKESALQAGALGFGISGSGPSVFALTRGAASARETEEALNRQYESMGIPFRTFSSPVNKVGVRPWKNESR